MKRDRIISEAIELVLKNSKVPMTDREIYEKVLRDGLYEFNAKDPLSVLRLEVRKHCLGIDFPSASPIKTFKLNKKVDGVNYYELNSGDCDGSGANINYVIDIEGELLPEEKMVNAYNLYLADLKHLLLEKVRECHPSFFEKLVVDLLISMGYGCDDKSGQVIGKSHDGGIDGIISEDKLGLNLIYIQAKRYSEGNNVGRPEIQRFIGAMQKAEKGVFITTSKFTKEALEFANAETRKHIRLVDGDSLVELMIKHSVGLEKIKEYVVYKINEDFFRDIEQ